METFHEDAPWSVVFRIRKCIRGKTGFAGHRQNDQEETMKLKDQVAVVTGGGGGIGAGICRCLAEEGAHVVVSDLNEEAARKTASEVARMGVRAATVRAGVREKDQCESLVAKTLRQMGGSTSLSAAQASWDTKTASRGK